MIERPLEQSTPREVIIVITCLRDIVVYGRWSHWHREGRDLIQI
jgi:hypothetical protein